MNSDTSLAFTEPEVGGSQRQSLEEYGRITDLSNVDFPQFTSTTSEPSYPYGLTTAHSTGSSFTHIPTALGYSNIDPSLLQYDSYNTARPTPLPVAGRESSWDRSDLQSHAPPSNRRIHAMGDLNSDYTAGPSRPMAPPRMGRVASSSSNLNQGYRTNFRAPIPMPTYSANGDYCLSPLFGYQEPASESEADHQASTGPVNIVGLFHSEDAGPSRSMAPPRMGRVASSSSNFDQGYTRTDFRAPIPTHASYSLSANGAYSFSPFGGQAPEEASQYGTLERTNSDSYNQGTRPQHSARNGMPVLGHRFPTQAPTHRNHPQMYPPLLEAQTTVLGPNYLWDYSQPQKANYQVSDHANVNHPSQHIPPPTPLNAPTSDNSLGAWTFVNTFYPSPARISMKRRRSSLQDDQETAPQGELQEDPLLRPVKRMRREPSTLGVSAPYASGSGGVYTESGRLPSFSTNAQHHPLRHGTGHHEEPPIGPPITQRICLFDNCGATIHSPSAFAHHLTDAHNLPRSKGRKNAPRYPCLWRGCFDKNGGRREYAGNNIVRHATGHLVARRCELCIDGGKLWYGCRPDLLKHHYLKEHEVRRRADELPPLFFF